MASKMVWGINPRSQLRAFDVHFIELEADHRTTCRFGKGEIDQENLALVMRNIKRICLDTLDQGKPHASYAASSTPANDRYQRWGDIANSDCRYRPIPST